MFSTIASTATAALRAVGLAGWNPEMDMPDQFGKAMAITGANSGLGYEATKALAAHHATVIMIVRDLDKGHAAADRIRKDVPYAKLNVIRCDLSDMQSVYTCAQQLLATPSPLHALINNAGMLAPGPFTVTQDGFEYTMAINVYGALYLTLLLLPRLRASAPARVINVSSMGELMAGHIKWDDLRGVERGSGGMPPYAQSKLLAICLAKEMDRRLQGSGVDVFAVHPGISDTPGEDKSDKRYPMAIAAYLAARVHGQSPARGAISMLYAATEPSLQGRGGTYLGPNPLGMQFLGWAGVNAMERRPVNNAARDPDTCKRAYDEVRAVLDDALRARGLPLPQPLASPTTPHMHTAPAATPTPMPSTMHTRAPAGASDMHAASKTGAEAMPGIGGIGGEGGMRHGSYNMGVGVEGMGGGGMGMAKPTAPSLPMGPSSPMPSQIMSSAGGRA